MSNSTPICSLFCSRCKAADAKDPRHYDRDHIRNYLDVKVISVSASGALCKCQRCGYEYWSNSMAAKRAMRQQSELVPADVARRLEAICQKFARSVRDFPCGHKPNYASGECEACEALKEYDALAAVPNEKADAPATRDNRTL